MKAWKSLALLTAYIFLVVTVSAQGIGGAEITVEESLTTFVTEILGFPVADASEVILFVVGPIFAFYFFLTNMMTMAFENFEDRIGRDKWDKKEELPTNLKLFSLVTAFITVVTIGRVAPGLIMVFGALALILGILMMTGLLTRDENGNNGGGSEEDAGDTGGGADNNGNGATREDYVNRVADAAETATSGARDHLNEQLENQRKEALRYFQSDFLDEFEALKNNISDIRNHINSARSEARDNSKSHPKDFKKLSQRALICEKIVDNYEDKYVDDSPPASTNYDPSDSDLCAEIEGEKSNNEDIYRQLLKLNNQMDRALNDSKSIPDDALDEFMNYITLILAVGHFSHHHPHYEQLSTDDDEALKTLKTAESMGISSANRNDLSRLMSLATSGLKQDTEKLVEESEQLVRLDLRMSEAEIDTIKDLTTEDEEIHEKIKQLKNRLSNYSSGSGTYINDHRNYLQQCMKVIEDSIFPKAQSLKNQLDSSSTFESNTYKKIKELEEKL
ncbi:MAG: hypothetical protein R6V35_03090 [Candidatus Nanohaloarchaea archaeon]